MNVDVSKIVSDKLEQLEADGVIKRKIEETVEKTVTEAITSELSSYAFRTLMFGSRIIKNSFSYISTTTAVLHLTLPPPLSIKPLMAIA